MAFFRKRRARPHGHALDLSEDLMVNLASDSDVLQESSETFDAMRLRQVLGTLPQQYYDVIVLQFFEHKSYDEISDILSLAPGTVAVRLSRAKAKIKKTMETNGYHYA